MGGVAQHVGACLSCSTILNSRPIKHVMLFGMCFSGKWPFVVLHNTHEVAQHSVLDEFDTVWCEKEMMGV